jgi:spore maturation protein CgeB
MKKKSPLKFVVAGLSITSSWGNGHATTYRSLIRELCARGHDILFLERDVPWYAANRDLPHPIWGKTELYSSIADLKERFTKQIQKADIVIVGSYVPQGMQIGRWIIEIAEGITAFYDIDTPVTLAKLQKGDDAYLSADLIQHYDLYLSFTGGPALDVLQNRYGSPTTKTLYCSVDPYLYYPENIEKKWDLGYMGTYSEDRQPPLTRLMLEPATRWPQGRFVVAGPQYPHSIQWPDNLERIEHLPPAAHRKFYNQQKFTLNITREEMVRLGYSPSVRLFEAAACGIPIISDSWEGIETFFQPGTEILISNGPEDTLRYLSETTEEQRRSIGEKARQKVLNEHTASHRARQLEEYIYQLSDDISFAEPVQAT